MIWLRALSFILVVQLTVVALIPRWLAASSRRVDLGAWHPLGLLPVALGASLLAVCNVYFVRRGRGTAAPYDAPRTLVIEGPYRYVRNPMYLSATLIVTGLGIWWQAVSVLIWAAMITVAYRLFVRLYEEPHLRAQFGTAYDAYRRQVPGWWPRLRPASASP